jgi:hypothetical protein
MKLSEGVPYYAFSLMDRVKLDPLEIDFIVYKIIKNPIRENEIEFIRKAKSISAIYENHDIPDVDHWAYHSKEISAGKYPLELLPEHLRPLAQKLYYN